MKWMSPTKAVLALRENATLSTLRVSSGRKKDDDIIDDDALMALAESLDGNISIVSLWLIHFHGARPETLHRLFRGIATLKSLQKLSFSSSDIGLEGAKLIASIPTLQVLDLDDNFVGPEGAKALAGNTTLRELGLSSNSVGDEGAKAFAANTTLKILCLGQNGIHSEGVEALVANRTLRQLYFSGNRSANANLFASNTTLVSLFLGGYAHVGDDGAKAFAANRSLRSLDVSGGCIGPEGANALAANRTLRMLSLYGNKIGDEGVSAFAFNTTLRKLNIGFCGIGEEGAKALAANGTLQELFCWQNKKINRKGSAAAAFNAALEDGKNITLFRLAGDVELSDKVRAVLEQNKQIHNAFEVAENALNPDVDEQHGHDDASASGSSTLTPDIDGLDAAIAKLQAALDSIEHIDTDQARAKQAELQAKIDSCNAASSVAQPEQSETVTDLVVEMLNEAKQLLPPNFIITMLFHLALLMDDTGKTCAAMVLFLSLDVDGQQQDSEPAVAASIVGPGFAAALDLPQQRVEELVDKSPAAESKPKYDRNVPRGKWEVDGPTAASADGMAAQPGAKG